MMTEEDALKIKEWRVQEGCSWRTIAKKASIKWPEKDIPYCNQRVGMQMCYKAMEILGETLEDGWN